jgi:hypothetical protein
LDLKQNGRHENRNVMDAVPMITWLLPATARPVVEATREDESWGYASIHQRV